MSARNRRDPAFTDPLGLFGWDVLPGFYVVTASHRGCRSGSTPVLPVPPPQLGLSIALSCRHLHYRASHTTLKILNSRRIRGVEAVLVRVRVRGRRGHPVGIVTVRGRRTLARATLGRAGSALLLISVHKGARLRASYAGDGVFAASRSAAVRAAARRG